jgi:ribosomal protein S18 acetylase RimI-like enzyme
VEDRSPRIRRGGVADAAAIAAVIVRAFASYQVVLDPPPSALKETAETIATRLGSERGPDPGKEIALVAEQDGQIVGCVMLKPGSEVYIGRLAVDPAWHGRGIARALIAAVEAEGRERKARALTLGVRIALPDNQRLFLACGFREVRREAHPGYAHPTFIHMEKVLA